MNETDYELEKGVIDAVERTKRYARIALEYGELLKKLHRI